MRDFRRDHAPLRAASDVGGAAAGSHVVLAMAQRQRERATVKAVARHARRKRLRSSGRPTRGEWGRESEEAGA
jgi:hypothetical protein